MPNDAPRPTRRQAPEVGLPEGDCIFCRVVTGTAESARVHEDDRVLAFLSIAPAAEGHTLVVPKRHARNLFDIAPADLEAVAAATQRVALRLREALGCDGISVFQSNEAAGWQTVFHYHVHVVPRHHGDPLVPPWRPIPADRDALARTAARLRGAPAGSPEGAPSG